MPDDLEFKHLKQEISELKTENSRLADENGELQVRAATYTQIFKQHPIPMAITRMIDGVFMEMNDAWDEVLGYSREEMLGKTVLELNLWKDYGEREVLVNHISINGYVKYFPCSFIKKSGEILNFMLTVKIIEFNQTKCLLSSAIVISLPE